MSNLFKYFFLIFSLYSCDSLHAQLQLNKISGIQGLSQNTVKSIIAHPIVGVHDFALCNFSKIVAFQIVASDLIFFQSLNC